MQETHWLVSLVVSWGSLLLVLGTIVWGARRIAKALTTWEGRSIAQIADEYLRELKRSNEMLERFMSDYRQRLEALEKK
jgi:hypothetical protein